MVIDAYYLGMFRLNNFSLFVWAKACSLVVNILLDVAISLRVTRIYSIILSSSVLSIMVYCYHLFWCRVNKW